MQGLKIKPRNDLWRKRMGITNALKDAKLSRRNAFTPKQQRTRPKIWGIYRVEKKGVTLIEAVIAKTMAAALGYAKYDPTVQYDPRKVRHKPHRIEGGYFCQQIVS